MHAYKELIVWQKSMQLAKLVYELTNRFLSHELYGLCSQMRRCSVSVPSNIAEGSGRQSKKEFQQFLSVALGSATELETQLLLARDLSYVDETAVQSILGLVDEVQKMLYRLVKKFREENN